MKTREWMMQDGGWQTRRVLECGSPLPLFPGPAVASTPHESARGLTQSKTWRQWPIYFCFLLSVFSFRGSAQSYSIDWYKVAGGGGTSTGGTYSVSGTIGQHDAGGPMTGGNYSLTGGFWALISVVQTPGAPTLYISRLRQHGDGVLAERVGLEFAAEQQSGRARGLDGQQRRDDLQRHQLSEHHVTDGEFVFPIEQSLKRLDQR